MATMFGRFEVQSELSKSETALIYKALDTKSNLVVALKVQNLEPLGARSEAFVNALIVEGESTRDLASQNIVLLYGAGEIDRQFCAAMEYIQGNSVGTMLARKEGFSIWDLLDITRQVCAGLECADTKRVVHCSLEPAKIMVQWDGMVKILGYGISNMSLIEAESGKSLGRLMPYCSPEQIRGETIDLRSNLFTLGAILYEMVVGQKAFDAADPVALVNQIENEMPAVPSSVNSKIQPGVSALIMKALAKDPLERYQSARELLYGLEECKESGKKAAPDSNKTTPAANVVANSAVRAALPGRFASAALTVAKPSAFAVSAPSVSHNPVSSAAPRIDVAVASRVDPPATLARAAAAGELDVSAPGSQAGGSPVLSAAVAERESEQRSPRVAVDPMMAEPAAGSSSKSFSDLAEMPPLKAPVFEPSGPEPGEPALPVAQIYPRKEKKPKKQPREVAEKTIQQFATLPPRLMLYSILGAVGLILVIVIALFFHVRSEDDQSTAAPQPTKAATPNSSGTVAQVAPKIERPAPPIAEVQPSLKVRPLKKAGSNSSRRALAPVPAPVVVPSQTLIDSNPAGAQFQVDGRSDPSWVTPFNLIGLSPGKHIISVSKPGYSSEIRSVEVVASNKSSLALHLSAVDGLMTVNSTPPGAEVLIDGKPTGRVTPAQFSVEKGSHTVLLRKPGYLDETTIADLSPAQNFQYSPALKALGNTADMRTVGKLGKLFGHSGDSTAGMGSISVHTQPKGAQVSINQSVLDKTSPVDVMLGPGNYIVDIALTGFKPIRKVVSVDKGGKAAIVEILERQ